MRNHSPKASNNSQEEQKQQSSEPHWSCYPSINIKTSKQSNQCREKALVPHSHHNEYETAINETFIRHRKGVPENWPRNQKKQTRQYVDQFSAQTLPSISTNPKSHKHYQSTKISINKQISKQNSKF